MYYDKFNKQKANIEIMNETKIVYPVRVYTDASPEEDFLQIQVATSTNCPSAMSMANNEKGYSLGSDTVYLNVINESRLKDDEYLKCELYHMDDEEDYKNMIEVTKKKRHFVTEVFIPNWGLYELGDKDNRLAVGYEVWVVGDAEDTSYKLSDHFASLRIALFTEKKKAAKSVTIVIYEDVIEGLG